MGIQGSWSFSGFGVLKLRGLGGVSGIEVHDYLGFSGLGLLGNNRIESPSI